MTLRSLLVVRSLLGFILLAGCWDGREQVSAKCEVSQKAHSDVIVPAGITFMGDTVYQEEGPRRAVSVDGFRMDVTEVTNDQFERFVELTGYVTRAERGLSGLEHSELPPELRRPGGAVFDPALAPKAQWRFVAGANWRHPLGPQSNIEGKGFYPVVQVSHEDAKAYAKWAGRRLPTEEEWEHAARDGREKDGSQPAPTSANTWQGTFPFKNTGDDGHIGLAPIACFTPNGHGIYDLIGNVWEWTDSTGSAEQAVIKGGSYLCAENFCMRYRPGARQAQDIDFSSSHIGFRTVGQAERQ